MAKAVLKKMVSLVAWVMLWPVFLTYKVQSWFTKSERFFADCAQLVSLAPGLFGNYLRKEFYKFTLKHCSDTCCISFGTIVSHPEAEIGDNVYIGLNCTVGTVTIEENVLIGSNVDILDGGKQHNFDSLEVPIRFQPRAIRRVTVGKDSWIGNSSVVMANIGEGVVIGAGSVVVKEIDKFSIAVGNPARVIKKRT